MWRYLETFYFLFYLCVYFWLGWVFVATCKLSLVAESGGSLSSCGVWASHCSGFSCWRAYAPGCIGFSNCGTWAQQLCTGLVALCHPGPEIELESPALAGWFLTTGPQREAQMHGNFKEPTEREWRFRLLWRCGCHRNMQSTSDGETGGCGPLLSWRKEEEAAYRHGLNSWSQDFCYGVEVVVMGNNHSFPTLGWKCSIFHQICFLHVFGGCKQHPGKITM